MKKIILLLSVLLCIHFEGKAQTAFVLEPSQSMLMTGKGPGQDATINPYSGQDCYAIVKNIGEREFTVRVQQGETIIVEISVPKNQTKKVTLLKGYRLYLDPNPKGIAKARVDYEKISG